MTNRTRALLESEFDSKLPDNSEQVITSLRLRDACTDMNDTIFRDNAIALGDNTGRILLGQGGYLLQGISVVTVLVNDTFTDTDGTNLTSHDANIETDTVGTGWWQAGSTQIHIYSNQCTPQSSAAHTSKIDTGETHVTVTAEMVWDGDATTAAGVWLRGKVITGAPPPNFTASHGFLVGVSSSGASDPILRIWKYAGSYVAKASTTMTGEGSLSGETWEIKAWSDTDGVHGEMTVNGTTYNVDFTTTDFTDGTYTLAGIRLRGGTGQETLANNFQAILT